ncbi:DUF3313 family protein [Massilia antarctica]|uniref:DUF3313 family protein n=1 Tax=Massilia antarctica TaxID=2765360 RepID=UPI0022704C90|nr:DUF3313 family protein [Massilia sp. H27-R4]MCY0916328.1 DUF3313 family protein [Massilia sp. H27-R4]
MQLAPIFSLSALALMLLLGGCGTTMPVTETAFLSSYTGLSETPDGAARQRRTTLPIDPASIVIEDPEWRGAMTDADLGERVVLLARLKQTLRTEIGRLPAARAARKVRIRSAITRVVPVSPALNTVATLMLIGPVDRGGAAVEIEAIDVDTGKQLAALNMGYYAPVSDLKARFATFAPAALAIDKAASSFAPLLFPADAVAPTLVP